MKTLIKLNDTLRITNEQGFPGDKLDVNKHLKTPYRLEDFEGQLFSFEKPLPRIFCLPPTRNFLVQEVDGKWIKWGHCVIVEQTIHNGTNTTGKFKITKLYDPEYMRLATINDTPEGVSYFK